MIDRATARRGRALPPSTSRPAPLAEFDTAALDAVLGALFDSTELFTRKVPQGTDHRQRGVTVHPSEVAGPKPVNARDREACAATYTIRSLLACQATTYRVRAARMGLEITDLSVEIVGDLDLAALLADPEPAAGMGRARVRICIVGPEEPARYQELHAAVAEHGPVGRRPRTTGLRHPARGIRSVPDQPRGPLDVAVAHR